MFWHLEKQKTDTRIPENNWPTLPEFDENYKPILESQWAPWKSVHRCFIVKCSKAMMKSLKALGWGKRHEGTRIRIITDFHLRNNSSKKDSRMILESRERKMPINLKFCSHWMQVSMMWFFHNTMWLCGILSLRKPGEHTGEQRKDSSNSKTMDLTLTI